MKPLRVRYADQEARHILISLNPKAGSGKRRDMVGQLVQLLRDRDYHVETVGALDELGVRSHELLQDQSLRVVVAAGGDGTVACVLNETPVGTPLTVLPLGTENLFAKYLGIGTDPFQLADLITRGGMVSLDAGRAGDRLFALMFSCGLDAEVVHRLDARRTGSIRHFSYALPIAQSLFRYDYPEVRLHWPTECDVPEIPSPLTARWAFVVNLPQYALGLTTAPEASGTDGLFDICTFEKGSLLDGLRYLAAVMGKRQSGLKDCTILQLPRLRLESDRRVPYQVDGDPGGELPVELEVLPGRLTTMVPEEWVKEHLGDPGPG